ncbi:MAG: hypothetical protein ACOX8Q_04795 [Christensenellales bacterium]|jgi:hypothetical protein
MICDQCRLFNKDGAIVCKRCGTVLGTARDTNDTAISSITIDIPAYKKIVGIDKYHDHSDNKYDKDLDSYDEDYGYQKQRSRKWLAAGVIAAGSVIVAGFIIFCILMLTQPGKDISAEAPVVTVSAAVLTTSSPTETPTPIRTTKPESTEDYSSIFEQPADTLIRQ